MSTLAACCLWFAGAPVLTVAVGVFVWKINQ